MNAADSKPAVSYLRRSTDRQEQSLPDQRKEVARYSEANGYRIIREYIDDAISGTSAKARPGFRQMIEDAKKREFSAVIIWSSDRFSRADATETEHFRFLLREEGVTVLSCTEDYLAREGLDGDILRAVKQSQNRQYSVNLSQNTLRGQISSVLKESDPGRLTPYGYDREIANADGTIIYRVRFLEGGDREVRGRDDVVQTVYRQGQMLRKPGKECVARLILSDDRRVRAVRDIFAMCLDGVGFRGIANELNRRGLISPKGHLWQYTTVRAIVTNPVYRGDIVWNRRTESKFFEVSQKRAERIKPSGRSGLVQKIDPDDWIVIPNAVPAIVCRDTWDKAQAACKVRAESKGGAGKQTNRWLLSSVIKCACCGQPYWGTRKCKGHIEGRAPVVKTYYVCGGRFRFGKTGCPTSAHVPAAALEAWVLNQLKDAINADEEGVESAIDRFVEAVLGARCTDTTGLQNEVAQIDRDLMALVRGLDPANLPLINQRLTSLRQRREYLLQQIRAASSSEAGLDKAGLRRWATERIGLLSEMVAGRRDERTRQVIASYVDKIVLNPATKTGTMALNAGLHALYERRGPDWAQKPRDPPGGGSEVDAIAGARFELATFGL